MIALAAAALLSIPSELPAVIVLLLAVAVVVMLVTDDDDLPGPRLCRAASR